MPADDREVFEYLRKAAGSPEVAGLAYASYAFEKYEWFDRQVALKGVSPPQADVENWVAGIPESKLDSLVVQATDLFERAAEAYLAPKIAHAAQRAAKKAVSKEVRKSNRSVLERVERATSYWRNFLGNVFIGLIASIIFVLVVAGGAWIFNADPSPFAALKQLFHLSSSAPHAIGP